MLKKRKHKYLILNAKESDAVDSEESFILQKVWIFYFETKLEIDIYLGGKGLIAFQFQDSFLII